MYLVLILACANPVDVLPTPSTEECADTATTSDSESTEWDRTQQLWEQSFVRASLAHGVENPQSRTVLKNEHDWTVVLNPEGIQGAESSFDFGEECGITYGVIELIGIMGAYGSLVRYTPDDPSRLYACPAGTYFLVEVF